MNNNQNACCNISSCPVMLNRRRFLSLGGTAVLAAKMGLFDFASECFAAEKKPGENPRVRVAFIRPEVERYWLGWPGASYNIKERESQYRDILDKAAVKYGVTLEYEDKPVLGVERESSFIESLKKTSPDGLLLMVTNNHYYNEQGTLVSIWDRVANVAKNRGPIPTIVFSPMGTSMGGDILGTRAIPGVFTASTQDLNWLAFGIRMFRTIQDMKKSRICIIAGDRSDDKKLEVTGTTLHFIPSDRFGEEFQKVSATDEMRRIAEYYTREAKMIVEPTADDILTAAKNYVVIRRIMDKENCNGFSMDCLGPVGKHKMQPPCLAQSHLQDEGIVGACESDWDAAISQRLTNLLFDKPGFIQDPAPNTISNTLMGAHCTSPTRLDGFDKPHEPFIIRNHSESAMGVSLQVLWRIGQKVTVMRFMGPGKIIAGTGTVVSNIDTPPAGGCRTSVELEMDNCGDTRDVKGFHQLFIYGDLEQPLRSYCELAGIVFDPIVETNRHYKGGGYLND